MLTTQGPNIMGKYWLLDRHGAEGPSVLVETDGAMRIVDVLRFGPDVTELDDQRTLLDDVIGRVAPTLKPVVKASKLSEEGIAPHAELSDGDEAGSGGRGRAANGKQTSGGGRSAGGSKRTGGRGRG
jgi:hypothetical protein